MESLELVAADMARQPARAERYDSDHFTLVSTGIGGTHPPLGGAARTDLHRVRAVPPADREGRPGRPRSCSRPTRTSTRRYSARSDEPKLLNPAVYDVANNRILCGTELKRLGDELQTARIHHSQQLATLDEYEESVKKLYKGAELTRHSKTIALERKRVSAADAAQRGEVRRGDRAAVRGPVSRSVPRVRRDVRLPAAEAGRGEGRQGHRRTAAVAQRGAGAGVRDGGGRGRRAARRSPRPRAVAAREGLVEGEEGGPLVPLGDLLATGRDAFLASHADQKAAADRAYLTSWALAYYLTFDRRLIGTEAFSKYLIAVNSRRRPEAGVRGARGEGTGRVREGLARVLAAVAEDGTLAK